MIDLYEDLQAGKAETAGIPTPKGESSDLYDRIDTGGLTPLDTSGLREIDVTSGERVVTGFEGFYPGPFQVGDRPAPDESVYDTGPEAMLKLAQNIPELFERQIGGAIMKAGESVAESARPGMHTGLGAGEGALGSALAGAVFAKAYGKSPEDVHEAQERDIESARDNAMTRMGLDLYRRATRDLEENRPNLREGSVGWYAYLTGEAITNMVPSVLLSIATRSPGVGLSLMGGQVFGDQYAAAREMGLDPEAATAQALFYAATELVSERIPLGILSRQGKSAFSRALKAGLSEGLQEPITEALQMAYEAGVLGDDISLQDAVRRLFDAGVIGFGAGGGLAVMTEPLVRMQRQGGSPVDSGDPKTPDEVTTFAAQRLNTLEGQAELSPDEQAERDFLRAAAQDPRAVAGAYGARLAEPAGEREAAETITDIQRADTAEDAIDAAEATLEREPAATEEVDDAVLGGAVPGVRGQGQPRREGAAGLEGALPQTPQEAPAGPGRRADEGITPEVDAAAAEAATNPASPQPEPSEAQKEAGNFRKGHVRLGGLDISIENPAGTRRRPEWPPLEHTYGYIRGTVGKDKDHVDVFLGPQAEAENPRVFVVDQKDPKTDRFDEHKVMFGFDSAEAAEAGYRANYQQGWQGFDGLREFTLEEFGAWVADPENTKQRAAQKGTAAVAPVPPQTPQEITDPARLPSNSVIAEARDRDGNLIGYFAVAHDGTEAGKRQANEGLRTGLKNRFDRWSNINTRAGITDANGTPAEVISPNGRHISPVGSDDAAYTFGDTEARPQARPPETPPQTGLKDPDARTGAAAPTPPSAPERAPIATTEAPDAEDTTVTPTGREVPVRYVLVEAADLVASQTDDGRANPDYPAELQPRDRSRAVSAEQIRKIAAQINPRLLDRSPHAADGAPIIGPDGVVESGNARVLAVRRAYGEGLDTAQVYRDYLAAQGYPVEGLDQPVLVRVRRGELAPAERAAFTREANESATLGMSATERALADAAAMPEAVLSQYAGGDVDAAANRDFVRAFLERIVSPNERAGMLAADGSMSQEAVRRIEAALLAKAYGDADLLATLVERPDSNIRAIGGALLDVAPQWALMRAEAGAGRIEPAMDQTERLLESVRMVQRARRERRGLGELVGQQGLFSGEAMHPVAEWFLRLMFRNTRQWTQPSSRDKMAGALRHYLDVAGRAQPGVDLLGETAPSPERILRAAKERQYAAEEATTSQQDLLAQSVRRDGVRERAPGEERGQQPEPAAAPARGRADAQAGRAREAAGRDVADESEARYLPRRQRRPGAVSEPGPAARRPPGAAPLRIEDRSEASIIVRGDTGPHRDRIRAALPGRKPLWSANAHGWVFPKAREDEVRAALADLLEGAPAAAPRPPSAPSTGEMVTAGSTRTGRLTRGQAPAATEAATPIDRIPSPHQLIRRLRKHFDVPLRQGRITRPRAAGVHGERSGVVRQRNMADIEVFSHEAGHFLESRYGDELTRLIAQHADEIAPLSYDPSLPRGQLLREGFAEWFSIYLLNRPYVERHAPTFTAAFDRYMARNHAADKAELDSVRALYQQYLQAPSDAAVSANVVTSDRGPFYRRFFGALNPRDIRDKVAVFGYQAYTAFVDRQHPIYVAVQRLRRIHDSQNVKRIELKRVQQAHVLARLALDSASAGHAQVDKGVIPYDGTTPEGPGLAPAIRTAMVGALFRTRMLEEFGAYLVSRRAIHEWDRYEAGDLPRPPTQQTRADHEQNIREMEARHPQFAAGAAQVYTFLQNHWRKKRDAGLITEDQYQAGLDNHPDYVPFIRDRSDLTEGAAKRGGGTGRAGVLKRFRGSDRPIINPLEAILADVYQTESMIKSNDARRALADLADAVKHGGGAIIEKIPDHEIESFSVSKDEVRAALSKQIDWTALDDRDAATFEAMLAGMDEIDAPMLRFFRAGDTNERGEPIIYVWRNGNREAYRLADGEFGMDLYNAITNLNREQVPVLVNAMGLAASTLRLGITTEPSFQVSNTLRGELTAWALQPGYRPGWDFAKGAKSAAIYDHAKQAYVGAGGMMGGINTASLGAQRAQKDIAKLAARGIDIRRASFRDVLALSEFSESAMRIGLFKRQFQRAKKRGLTDKEAAIEAAFVARDITDYGRHGSKMVSAKRLVTFMNAAIQGIDKAARVLGGAGSYQQTLANVLKHQRGQKLTQQERQDLWASMRLVLNMNLIGLIGVCLTALYSDDEEYEEISEYLRATHWMVKFNGTWYAVPKPFQEALLSNIYERAYEQWYYNDPEAMDRLRRSIGFTLGVPFIPALINPMVEHFANKSLYNDMPLISRRLQGLEPSQQYYAWTSSFARWAGEKLDVAPILIDHYITSYTGTWGRSLLSATAAVEEGAPEQGYDDMFFFRRFVRDPTRSAFSQEKFYKMIGDGGELSAKYMTFSNFVDDDHNEQARRYLRKMTDKEAVYVMARYTGKLRPSQSRRKYHPLERARDATRRLYQFRREVRESERLTPDQKRRLDDNLSRLALAEYRNAMIAARMPGYELRKRMDAGAILRQIRLISAPAAADLERRLARNLPPAEAVYKAYPQLERAMLTLRDQLLATDADLDREVGNRLDATVEAASE